MKLLEREGQSSCADKEINGNYHHSKKIKLMLVGNLGGALEPVELIEPAAGDCGSGSRISSGAIAGADDVLLFQIQASNFTLVNISAVIAPRRRCSESMNSTFSPFAIKSDYAHGVASFNMFDFLPANSVARERIDNFDSLVEENHAGLMNIKKQMLQAKIPQIAGIALPAMP